MWKNHYRFNGKSGCVKSVWPPSVSFRSTATVVANRNTSLIQIHKSGQDFYRPQQYLRKGNVFIGVCLFVHHPGRYPPRQTPPPRQTLRRQTLHLSSRQALQADGTASYWMYFCWNFIHKRVICLCDGTFHLYKVKANIAIFLPSISVETGSRFTTNKM